MRFLTILCCVILIVSEKISAFKVATEDDIPTSVTTACREALLTEIECPEILMDSYRWSLSLQQHTEICQSSSICSQRLTAFSSKITPLCAGQMIDSVPIVSKVLGGINYSYNIACAKDSNEQFCSYIVPENIYRFGYTLNSVKEYPKSILCSECFRKLIEINKDLNFSIFEPADLEFAETQCKDLPILPLPYPITTTPTTQQPRDCPGMKKHITRRNDSCYMLSIVYDVTADALLQANPSFTCENIYVGQEICIPSSIEPTSIPPTPTATPNTCKGEDKSYIVRAGDTCFAVALSFGLVVEELKLANPNLDCSLPQIGLQLCVPFHTPPTTSTTSILPTGTVPVCNRESSTYTIKQGDHCKSIYEQYGISKFSLVRDNPGLDCNHLTAGQTICIPQVCRKDDTMYRIKAQDTCLSIIDTFKLTVNEFMLSNPTLDCSDLYVNQIYCISRPAPPTTTPPATTTVLPTPTSTPVTCQANAFRYTVKAGDTCYLISTNNGITLENLLKANPGVNCDVIYVGQTFCIPGGATIPPKSTSAVPTPTSTPSICQPNATKYTVKAGDTCYLISTNNGITLENLLKANPGVNCDVIFVGQSLCIPRGATIPPKTTSAQPTPTPTPATCQSNTIKYTVKSGDSCHLIATNNGITVDKLTKANPGVNCNSISIGQSLCVPLLCMNGEKSFPVASGNTCDKISKSWKVTLQQLLKSNPGLNCDKLQIGQMICRPGSK
ncbi:hypothetical protein K7432_008447 [Basidiobolus ranarum]|uniref:LysM domain-containing protein n=1 Tax=Basidiobolus ranarum TaxID=34480 RepID=A0ABR2WRT6_9FUNG